MSRCTQVVIVRRDECWPEPARLRPVAGGSGGLSRLGAVQAARIAEVLAGEAKQHGGFEVFLFAPHRACLETAAPIGEALGIKPVIARELCSADHGPGDPWDAARVGLSALPPFAEATAAVKPETARAYLWRVAGFLAKLPELEQVCPGGRVLLVGPGEIQLAAITGLLRLPVDAGRCAVRVDHGGISRWAFEREPGSGVRAGCWTLSAHNETGHLQAARTRAAAGFDGAGS